MNLVWFRNDIRLDDNPALTLALQQKLEQGVEIKALFIETPVQWQRHNRATIQIHLLQRHLNKLAQQLCQYGVELHHIRCDTFSDVPSELLKFCHVHNVTSVISNQEVEVNEVTRDTESQQLLSENGIDWHSFEADVVLPKGQVLNGQGEMYRVFTPFKKAALRQLSAQALDLSPSHHLLKQLPKSPIEKPEPIQFEIAMQSSDAWPTVDQVWREQWLDFAEKELDDYQAQRDFPALEATSKLSPYLAIGAISPRRLVQHIKQTAPMAFEDFDHPRHTWLSQLIWRDFYRHLIFHYPQLVKGANFNTKYDKLAWPNDPTLFETWRNAKTGYPIVDAAMRQLEQTGWMHNRLRMIVASFLTKHLLVDWRHGERHFCQKLIDLDFANNNGGWQWAASTGCDAQPYFRIFNPIAQSEKFDPDGTFIRKYLPELEKVPLKHLHFPHDYLIKHNMEDYWPAVVEHKQARLNALDLFKSVN